MRNDDATIIGTAAHLGADALRAWTSPLDTGSEPAGADICAATAGTPGRV